eukprot:1152168-Pelagomonas_calceolata.AAC.7
MTRGECRDACSRKNTRPPWSLSGHALSLASAASAGMPQGSRCCRGAIGLWPQSEAPAPFNQVLQTPPAAQWNAPMHLLPGMPFSSWQHIKMARHVHAWTSCHYVNKNNAIPFI